MHPHTLFNACCPGVGEYSGANVVAILKEVAPSGSVKTDEELGVQVFQETYFNNFPVYLDEKRDFYKFLGSRNVMSQKWSTYNPFKLYSGLKSITNRLVRCSPSFNRIHCVERRSNILFSES